VRFDRKKEEEEKRKKNGSPFPLSLKRRWFFDLPFDPLGRDQMLIQDSKK